MSVPACTCVDLQGGERHRGGCPELAEAMWMQTLLLTGRVVELEDKLLEAHARQLQLITCEQCHHLFQNHERYSHHLCVGGQGR